MPLFMYNARNRGGRRVKGDVDSASLKAARTTLERRGFSKIKVKPRPKDLLEGTFLEEGVKARDMVVFNRQFATMINAGVPILQALQVLCEQTENGRLRRTMYSIRSAIEGGSTLHNAMRAFPDIFDALYVNMINAGEVGGILDTVLIRLSEYIETAARLRAKIRGAMIYPAVVFTVAVAVVAIVLVFVVPTFETMFKDLGGVLPVPTRLVIAASRFVQEHFIALAVGSIVVAVALKLFCLWEQGRVFVDKWLLFLPIVGPLFRKAAVARFSRTMSTMLSSGVPILESLDIVAKTSGNRTLERGVMEAAKSIAEGENMAEPLDATGVFPPMVIHMIAVGESTGTLDVMLAKIADFYDDEVDVAVESLTALVEPLMILVLGLVVGALVVSMYLPIFRMGEAL